MLHDYEIIGSKQLEYCDSTTGFTWVVAEVYHVKMVALNPSIHVKNTQHKWNNKLQYIYFKQRQLCDFCELDVMRKAILMMSLCFGDQLVNFKKFRVLFMVFLKLRVLLVIFEWLEGLHTILGLNCIMENVLGKIVILKFFVD